MPFEYLPIMAQNSAPKPPRVLAAPSKPAWCGLSRPARESRIALLSSAALRLVDQAPFIPREDLSYRRLPADPGAGAIIIDHHSGIGRVPSRTPRLCFRAPLWQSWRRKESSASYRPFTSLSWAACGARGN